MDVNAIELNNVQKTYGKVTALDDLSLNIRAGELTALLGPNGAGKTTAISLMQGLAAPTKGEVKVMGVNPRQDGVRTRIGSMPQESAIPQALTVLEAVQLFASFYPAPLELNQALKLADLESVASRRAGVLSGGQKRRLAFALAIVGNPEILLIDEPTTGMDAQSRLAFWSAIEDLKQSGRTILLTTHYLEEAEALCGRIAMLKLGHVVALDRTSSLLARATTTMLRFRLDQPLPPALAAHARVTGRIVQLAAHDAREVEQVLATLRAEGLHPEDLEIGRPDLEDVFIDIMNGEPVEARAA